jgi:hypothetical protein
VAILPCFPGGTEENHERSDSVYSVSRATYLKNAIYNRYRLSHLDRFAMFSAIQHKLLCKLFVVALFSSVFRHYGDLGPSQTTLMVPLGMNESVQQRTKPGSSTKRSETDQEACNHRSP